jgi:putative transposase
MSNDSFDKETKKKLCFINKYNLYFYKGDYSSKNIEVSYDIIKIAKWIFRKFIGKFPDCRKINMTMQDKVAQLETSKSINKDKYPYVIRLSTQNRGKLITLPIERNKYFDKFNGNLKTSTEFIFEDDKLTYIKLTKELKKKRRKSKKKRINYTLSIDIGLNNLISTNNGQLFGIRYLRNLKRLDKNLIILVNKLKEKHGKYVKLSKFEEYNRLVSRIGDYTKNEVNRIINRLYLKHKPTKINVEELNFKNSNLSRRLNRLLSRFGLGSITSKLKSLEEIGVEITYIDSAYTSLTCNVCGYVDKDNRKKQEEFKCKCCGLKQHADVNAARTIDKFSKRFGTKIFYGKKGREDKLKLIIEDFINFGSQFWMNNESVIQTINRSKYGLLFQDKIKSRLT